MATIIPPEYVTRCTKFIEATDYASYCMKPLTTVELVALAHKIHMCRIISAIMGASYTMETIEEHLPIGPMPKVAGHYFTMIDYKKLQTYSSVFSIDSHCLIA